MVVVVAAYKYVGTLDIPVETWSDMFVFAALVQQLYHGHNILEDPYLNCPRHGSSLINVGDPFVQCGFAPDAVHQDDASRPQRNNRILLLCAFQGIPHQRKSAAAILQDL